MADILNIEFAKNFSTPSGILVDTPPGDTEGLHLNV